MDKNGSNSNGSYNSQKSFLNKAKIEGDNIDALIEKIDNFTGKIDNLIAEMKDMKAQVNNAATSMDNAVQAMNKNVTNAVQAMNTNVTNSTNFMKDAIDAIYTLINFEKKRDKMMKKKINKIIFN